MKKVIDFICLIFFIGLCIASVLFPGFLCRYVSGGINICLITVIPTLFPFIIISRILSETQLITRAGKLVSPIISKVFGIDKNLCGPFLLGMFGGFPSGAISTGIIYKKGICSKESAERNLALCNNPSFSFISAVVGSIVLGSIKNGIILIFAQILTVIFTSLILRFIKVKNTENYYVNSKIIYESKNKFSIIKSLKQSTLNMLYICGFITIFYTISSAISEIFGNKFHLIFATKSLFEVTGAVDICRYASFPLNIVLCSMALGFSGLSVIFQILDICEEYGLSAKYFIASRFIGAVLMPLFTVLIMLIAPRDAINVFYETSLPLNMSTVNFRAITLIYALVLILVMIIFGILYYIATLFENIENLNNY